MNKEDILNQALEELRAGKTQDEVSSKWPEYAELGRLLSAATALLAIPKNKAPEPVMRRKFAMEPAKAFVWSSFLHMIRFSAASTAAVLLVTALSGTAYATFTSLPGQTLFPLKKQAERIQLHLTSDPVTKANIQVSITQKRLADAEKVFSNPEKNTEQEIAVLNELSKQTKETASTVKSAAQDPTTKDNQVVDTFADVTKKQQALLSKITTENEVAVAANTAQEATNEAKETIAVVAATNDPALITTINSTSSPVSSSGSITALSKTSLTLDNETFTIDKNTMVKNFNGTSLEFSELATGTVVHVSGLKDKNGVTAKEITAVKFEDAAGAVQGTSTPATSTPAVKPLPEPKTSTTTKKSDTPSTTPDVDPNQATGSFIPEFP